MNLFIGAGRLTRDPEILYTPTGKMVARFTIAISRPKSASGDKITDFINCQAWEKTAELIGSYFTKGSGITVEGQLNIDQVTEVDGTRKTYAKINVSKVHFPLSKSDQTNQPDQPAPVSDIDTDDCPF